METKEAAAVLSALAHESRLEVFRLLVKAGPEGVPAGEIATELGLAPPTLSFHLSQLVNAGLIQSRREGRSILYGLSVSGIHGLLEFITQDCCQGRPELCQPSCAPTDDCAPCDS
ncbi:MAG: ArsR family transcriptional regulator [Pseudohongiellaceae bacterium]|jgi:ArsR family transcriptional regulator